MKRICFLVVFSIVLGGASLGAQTINTVAGGVPTYPLPALSAPIGEPTAVAFDSSGNYYVASLYWREVFKVDTAGNVTVFAGNGLPCPTGSPMPSCGDGGPATSASLTAPYSLAVDSLGRVFIADTFNNRIRMVDTTGTITTFAGNGTRGFSGDGGPATSASLNDPYSVAVDSLGRVFIADTFNNRIRMVDINGMISTVAGGGLPCNSTDPCGDWGPATSATLAGPMGVAVDPMGNFFIADTGHFRVRAVNFGLNPAGAIIGPVAGDGSPVASGDGGAPTDAGIGNPRAVAIFPGPPLIWIAGGPSIRVVESIPPAMYPFSLGGPAAPPTPGETIESVAPSPTFAGADGVTWAPAGGLYVPWNNRVYLSGALEGPGTPVAGNGTPAYYGDGGPATQASFTGPPSVAMDQSGNIYIADPGDACVRKLDAATGIISTIAGIPGQPGYSGDGGPATSAKLNNPTAVALDSAGNLYIADSMNAVVREVDAITGTISTVAGSALGFGFSCTQVKLLQPNGLYQYRQYCYSGEGGPATSASMGRQLGGIALDSANNLYIADTQDYLVLKVSAATGLISTVAGVGLPSCNPLTGSPPCFSGDGGPATSASLNSPNGVAVDSAGDVYIADTGNQRVRVVNASTGVITTVAGNGTAGYSGDGGPATSASLDNPDAVGLDSAGNLYIADTANQRIREVNAATADISTVAGNGTFGFSGDGGSPLNASLSNPLDVFVDKADGLWIADSGSHHVRSVGNTATGSNVAAAPVDSTTGTSPVTLTFSTVTQAGNVSLTTSTTGPAVPSGFQLGSPATYFTLTTSAVYSGSIQICINYSGVSYTDPSQLSIWHYDTSTSSWTQLTTTIDTATTRACATTPSLSPFALLQPAYIARIQPPISADGSSVFEAARGVVPVKFSLTLSGQTTCSLPPATISLVETSGASPGPVDQNEYTMPADRGSNFRIDTADCQYVYNLDASTLGAGTYQVRIAIGGAIVGSGVFGLK